MNRLPHPHLQCPLYLPRGVPHNLGPSASCFLSYVCVQLQECFSFTCQLYSPNCLASFLSLTHFCKYSGYCLGNSSYRRMLTAGATFLENSVQYLLSFSSPEPGPVSPVIIQNILEELVCTTLKMRENSA